MSFTLAHFSDVHLGPVQPGEVWSDFRLKRIIGGVSWFSKRRRWHQPVIANALRDDVLAAAPDHVCFSGDLVNIGSRGEFARGLAWLRSWGDPANLSFVPGNHDAYVDAEHAHGLSMFEAWQNLQARPVTSVDYRLAFPYVRLKRNIAIVGVNSALPQGLAKASGEVGERQRVLLADRLNELGQRGFYRVVMIHHPPLPGQCPDRRGLKDASAVRDILVEAGAELVIHGHNHTHSVVHLATRSGPSLVIGVPSASMGPQSHHDLAQWNMYSINRQAGQWQTEVQRHVWSPASQRFIIGPALTTGQHP